MQEFTDSHVVQSNTGSPGASSSINVTLPAGTTEGNTAIIVMGAQTLINSPTQWDLVITAGTGGPTLAIMCRADIPAGESSWPFTPISGGPNWTWTSAEWMNISNAPIETTATSGSGVSAPSSISTGTTGSFTSQYVMGIAAVQLLSTGGSAWPTVSWSSGFTETDVVEVGDGTINGHIQLRVARLYGTDSEVGPWSTTATFTGSMTSKTVCACLAVFSAAPGVTVPGPTVMAV